MCEISNESGSDFGESELSSECHGPIFTPCFLAYGAVMFSAGCNKSNLHLHIATGYFHFSCKPSQSTGAAAEESWRYKMTLGTETLSTIVGLRYFIKLGQKVVDFLHTPLTVLILKVKVACVYFVPLHCASSDGFLDGEKAGLFFFQIKD